MVRCKCYRRCTRKGRSPEGADVALRTKRIHWQADRDLLDALTEAYELSGGKEQPSSLLNSAVMNNVPEDVEVMDAHRDSGGGDGDGLPQDADQDSTGDSAPQHQGADRMHQDDDDRVRLQPLAQAFLQQLRHQQRLHALDHRHGRQQDGAHDGGQAQRDGNGNDGDGGQAQRDGDGSGAVQPQLTPLEQLLGKYVVPPEPESPPEELLRPGRAQDTLRLSLRHYRRWLRTKGTHEAYEEHAETPRELGHDIHTLYKITKSAEALSGIYPRRIDMCPNSCIAYTGEYAEADSCTWKRQERYTDDDGVKRSRTTVCGLPRRDNNGEPLAHYDYTPILDRLRAMYHNPSLSTVLGTYRHECLEALRQADQTGAWDQHRFTDTMDGSLHLHLADELGLFSDRRDVAIAISTDGAQIVADQDSNAWVILASCLNVPPNLRFKRAHQFVVAIIPGPNSPGDFESFFHPLAEEMAQLSVGAWAWDGAAAEWFLLRAHVAWVSADQPGSAKLSKMTGVTGRMGCRFCMIQGCYGKPAGAQDDDDSEDEEPPAEDLPERWARTPYFPLSTPTAVASLGPNRTRLPSYDPEALPLRTEDEYWDFLDELDGNVDEREFSRRTGISARPLLAALPSFVHPHFFPSDIFHLFTFNTLQLIWDTISLFKPGDPFNFAPRLRRKFGLAVVDAGSHLPGAFGSKPRNPHTKHNSHFKMVEWMATFHFYLGPYLQDAGAPTELLDMIVAILDGISFASQSHGCRFVEVHAVRRSFITFVTEWERLYIRNDDALLSRARLSIHLLLHIADQIAATGNPRATSQAACERQIGLIKGELRSFRDPYEALVRRTHLIEQVNALDLLLDPQDGVATRRDRQWLDHPDRPDGIRPGRSISLAKAKSICHRRTSLHAIRTALFAEGYNLKRDARLHGFARFTRSSFTFAVRSHLGRTSRTRRFSSVVAWSASPDHDLEYFDVLAFAIKTEEMVAVGRRFVVDCDRSRSSNHWVAGQWSPRLQVISVDGIHDIMGVFPIEATTYLFPRKNSFGGFAQWWAERCIASAETSEDDE